MDQSNSPNTLGSMYESPNCLLKLESGTNIHSMRINPVEQNLFVLATRLVKELNSRLLVHLLISHHLYGTPVTPVTPESL